MINLFRKQNGVALTIVMIVLMVLAIMSGYVMNLGYNRKRVIDIASGSRTRIYYRAQAGVWDAGVRIRRNYPRNAAGALLGTDVGSVGVDFTNPGYNPSAYTIDVDGNGRADTRIDIGAVDGQGRRPIISTGLETEL